LDGFTVFALDQNQQQQTSLAEVVQQTVTAVTVPFTSQATSNIGNTGPLTYTWDFGDGTTGSGTDLPASHDYVPGQAYNAQFTATCSDCPSAQQMSSSVSITIGQVKIQEVDFQQTNPLVKDPTATNGSAAGQPIQASWIAASSTAAEQQNPISYVRNATISLNATFAINPPLQTPITNVTIEGDGPDGISFILPNQTLSGSSAMFSMTADSELADMIQLYAPFTINWSVTPGSEQQLNAGMSQNRMYVTWASTDSQAQSYETEVNIATQGANGVTGENDQDVVNAVWAVFAARNVVEVDGRQMSYWKNEQVVGDPNSHCDIPYGLIYNADGQCGSWALFLIDTWLEEGITGSTFLEVLPNASVNVGAEGFFINSWSFGQHIRTGPSGVRNSDLAQGSDDTALFAKNSAYPYALCIVAGDTGVLQTQTTSGDDQFLVPVSGGGYSLSPTYVTTALGVTGGVNGVCETTAAAQDIQLVAVGTVAAPNEPVIGPGPDGVLNSTPTAPDVAHDGIYDGSIYPYVEFIPGESASAGFFAIGDASPQTRIPAQGNNDSPDGFYNHYVTLFNNQLYDPSYGAGPFPVTQVDSQTYTSIAHEVKAIAGISSCGPNGTDPNNSNPQTNVCKGVEFTASPLPAVYTNKKSNRQTTPELKYVQKENF
jgi:hypothetical protein